MIQRQLPKLFLVGMICALSLLVAGLVLVKVVNGDPDLGEPAPPSGPIMDQQTYLANKARTDSAEAAEDQRYQDALRSPVPSKAYTTPVPNDPSAAPIPTGVLSDFSLYPGWASIYHITNVWQQYVGGVLTGVYAGSKVDDAVNTVWNTPEHGVLVVMQFPIGASSGWGATSEYLTSTATGRLRVTSYAGTCLALLSSGGTPYYFDVAARQWSCPTNQQPPP